MITAMKTCARVPYQLEWCKNDDRNVYPAVLQVTRVSCLRRATASQRAPECINPSQAIELMNREVER